MSPAQQIIASHDKIQTGYGSHLCGIAPPVAMLYTDRNHGDGRTAVAIYRTHVDLVFLAYPTLRNDWRIVSRHEYTDACSFRDLLDDLTSEPTVGDLWT